MIAQPCGARCLVVLFIVSFVLVGAPFMLAPSQDVVLAQAPPTLLPRAQSSSVIFLPMLLNSPPPLPATAPTSAGNEHTCGVTSAGGVKCWGYNYYAQLGDGTLTDRLTPVSVSGLASGVVAIAAGFYHSCALTSAGGVKCWGAGGYGQVGDGTTIRQRLTPVDVTGLTSGVRAISGSSNHTCALTVEGGVKCWGYNLTGQLGDGTTTNRSVPVNVTGLASGVVAISANGFHTCALLTSGGVKCWGNNNYGELGDGTETNRTTPVDVSGLTSGVTAIAAGYYHTCALTSGGGIKCWGSNFYGGLGDGTTTDRVVPVDVSGLASGARVVAGGYAHTCALTGSGGVKCWGQGYGGQLGNGTSTNSSTPVDVSGLSSEVGVVAPGYGHTCASIASGIQCWGGNTKGMLGDGTTTDRPTPVNVVGF